MIGFYHLSDLGVDNMDLFRKESLASYMKTDGQMPKTMNAGDLMAMGDRRCHRQWDLHPARDGRGQ